MSYFSKGNLRRVLTLISATIVVLSVFATLAVAQQGPAPKVEIFGGYSFWYPGANVHGTLPGALLPLGSPLESNPWGVGAAFTYNFNRWLGVTFDGSTNKGSGERGVGNRIDDAEFSNLSAGPKITFRSTHFSPFLEVLVGDHRLYPEAFHHIDKLGFMAGGGVDLNLTRHVALRLLRADYVMSSYRYGSPLTTPATDLRGVRLQTGLNFMFGGEAPVLPSAACTVQPGEVFVGESVTATATGSNFNSKRTIQYEWSGTGVKVSGNSASVQIDTSGLQPGRYQVAAKLSDGSRHGVTSCGAVFIAKATHPPTISCAPNPATLQAGGTATITSSAISPDGRALTYSYTANAGSIRGNTSTAMLDTRGAQPGTITILCNVGDDRNPPLTASATAMVNLLAPPPPPAPSVSAIERRLAIHSIYFATAKPSPEHPDGGLLASQEKTLSSLASDFQTYLRSMPDARLTLEGHTDPRGSVAYNQALSERRVNRTKRFLVEQGVPDGSIDTKAFGEQQNLTDAEVRSAVERNPELSANEREKVLNNMTTVILGSNRRVDIRLSGGGQASQESVREYPFNAADSLALLDTRNESRKAVKARKAKRAPKE